jgi:GntR family carbon starvation induced transcriptional regulator
VGGEAAGDGVRARGGPGKATRATDLAETLRRAILSGELRPGAKVNLDQLRAAHGVSLSPLREAVARLLPTGLVEFEDQKGYRVTSVSRANLAEVTRLRADLETLALGHAIERAGLDWESGVLAQLHRLSRAARDPVAREAAHAAFHRALVEGCEMPLLLDACRTLFDLVDRYRRLFPPSEPEERDPDAEHTTIARAAVERNASEATRLLRAHVERTGASLAERVR